MNKHWWILRLCIVATVAWFLGFYVVPGASHEPPIVLLERWVVSMILFTVIYLLVEQIERVVRRRR